MYTQYVKEAFWFGRNTVEILQGLNKIMLFHAVEVDASSYTSIYVL
jgi:hypothetical protein